MKTITHVLLIFVGVLSIGAAQAQDATGDLLGRVNNLRASLGLAPYSLNGALSAAAANQAQWMASTGQISHFQPDGSTPSTRAAAAGYASSWVSENIYMGTNATTGSAWNFWINSSIHYRGLTSPNYDQVGIGTAAGENGRAYVMVFGASSAGAGLNVAASASRGGESGGRAAPSGPPPYVVGLDTVGNIMHEIQPGHTLGDIALIYGYSWDDIPTMLDLNELTWEDSRVLEIGSVFLVPPHSGTYTPTPGGPDATLTPTEDVARLYPTITPQPETGGLVPPVVFVQSTPESEVTAAPTATATPSPMATRALIVRTAPAQGTPVAAALGSSALPGTAPPPDSDGPPWWLIGAVVVQLGVLTFATVEFVRRGRR